MKWYKIRHGSMFIWVDGSKWFRTNSFRCLEYSTNILDIILYVKNDRTPHHLGRSHSDARNIIPLSTDIWLFIQPNKIIYHFIQLIKHSTYIISSHPVNHPIRIVTERTGTGTGRERTTHERVLLGDLAIAISSVSAPSRHACMCATEL
jgi:hypothetical protein